MVIIFFMSVVMMYQNNKKGEDFSVFACIRKAMAQLSVMKLYAVSRAGSQVSRDHEITFKQEGAIEILFTPFG
jgi:H2-forming N5,N10-methylenetetrahydromethanopterin dehydrogenase-like enzyme